MTSKKTLNTRNLEALGAERLAELLIEICKGRPAARRLLRLELAGALGTAELAREVRHRMTTIRRSRAVIDSRRRRDLVDDLELCRRTIVDRIAVEDAAEALDLMWQYMGLANPIQNRLHYTDETIAGAFSASDPGAIASAASPDPRKLADRAFEALTQNAHGQFDGLIGALTPALREVAAEIRPETVIVLQVDAAVRDAAEYAPDDLPDEIAIKGRGGTDFRPGFAWLDEQGIEPGVCLYFTDMECSDYPETEPGFPVLFCNWGPPPSDWNREPWGERIDIAA